MSLSRYWHHRICEAILFVSGLVIALYLWARFFTDDPSSTSIIVSNPAFVAALVTFGYAALAFLFTPRKMLTASAIIGYIGTIVMVVLLLSNTGYLSSPFIALWVAAAMVAAVFGVYGYFAITAGTGVYIYTIWQSGDLSYDALALAALFSFAPMAIGIAGWRTSTPTIASKGKSYHTDEDRSFSELSSQLEALTDQAHVVISAMTDGVISVDGQGNIQLFNPAATKLLGWDVSEALDLHYRSVLKLYDNHNTQILEVNNPIYQALNTNAETNSDMYSLEIKGGNGKKFLADITTTPIGEPGSGAIIVFRDVTRDRAEEREKAEFISTASHEMRTPVASIEGYLGLALNPSTATIDDKAREYIGKAQDAAKHLGRLFKDLLDVNRADDGRLVNNPRVIDIVPFVHDIVIGQTPAASAKGLVIDFPPESSVNEDTETGTKTLSPVYYAIVDPDHLREIVGNLLENAIKYTITGKIVVDITGENDSITISIQDSGVGIPKEDIPHLFQKFYRVDSADTREIGGTGLGLYLCRKLTEALDGKIWVESEYQKGSTFYLKLPRTDQETARNLLDQEKRAALKAAQESAQKQSTIAVPKPLAQPEPTSVTAGAQSPASQPFASPIQDSTMTVTPQSAPPVAPVPTATPTPQPAPLQAPPTPAMMPGASNQQMPNQATIVQPPLPTAPPPMPTQARPVVPPPSAPIAAPQQPPPQPQ